jgi:hypothetical protein
MKKENPKYTEDNFKGTGINCNHRRPTNRKILALLYVMIYESSNILSRPFGYHVRVRFTSKMNAQSFSARFTGYYKRKSNYNPLRVCTAETDPDQNGFHYHYAIILDHRHDTIGSLRYLMGELKKAGFVYDYHIKGHVDAPWGLPLNTPDNLAKYMYWLSYIAKTKTKPQGRQTYSASHTINTATQNWIKAGKPTLHLMHDSTTDDTQQSPLQDFLDNAPEPTDEKIDDTNHLETSLNPECLKSLSHAMPSSGGTTKNGNPSGLNHRGFL